MITQTRARKKLDSTTVGNTEVPSRVAAPATPYQALVQRLRAQGFGMPGGFQVVGFTSSSAGEGVTTVSVNVAVSAARSLGRPVLLIDANDSRPALASLFDINERGGFYDALAGREGPSSGLVKLPIENLTLLTAGSAENRQMISYDPAVLRELLDAWRHEFDLILIDLPPAYEESPCFALAGQLDGIVLVVAAGRARRAAVRRVKERLAATRASVLGAVLNMRRWHLPEWLRRRT
ncbi:MAG: CpsD/CapB family tyrosine-protein kinase [Pirellulales bacterium]